ncbi:MAG: SDR family NAD(P)-dependent oxidoreductase [Pseudomonadota bacterium]
MTKALILSLAILALCTAPLTSEASSKPASGQKTILITGASGKLGSAMTQHLSTAGYYVYAGARKEADLARLNQMTNVSGLQLDVNEPAQIAAAVKAIEKDGAGLHGLVNNAGILREANLLEMSDADFNAVMQVNIFGPFRVTKAMGPLLKAHKGRIVNISSTGSVSCLPSWGAYCMSKSALELYTDTLAMELRNDGVAVIALEPGNYGPAENGGGDPMDIARAVEQAVFTDPIPKARYLVVPTQKNATATVSAQFRRMLQMNQDHAYSLSLEELQKMLQKQYRRMNRQGQQKVVSPAAAN